MNLKEMKIGETVVTAKKLLSESELKQLYKLLDRYVSNIEINMSDFDKGSKEVKEYGKELNNAKVTLKDLSQYK